VEKQEQPITFRPEADTRDAIERWLETNPSINRTALINMAIRKFTSERQTLEPVEVVSADDDVALKTAKKMAKTHAHAMEKLK
jgi:hypothetical protein